MEELTPGSSLDGAENALSGDCVRHIHARGFQQSRHDVLQPDDLVARTCRQVRSRRISDDKGNTGGSLVGVGFSVQVVFTHHVAVIGGEEHERIVPQTPGPQHLDQIPHLVVDVGNASVV